jgi:hypothetical protein
MLNQIPSQDHQEIKDFLANNIDRVGFIVVGDDVLTFQSASGNKYYVEYMPSACNEDPESVIVIQVTQLDRMDDYFELSL